VDGIISGEALRLPIPMRITPPSGGRTLRKPQNHEEIAMKIKVTVEDALNNHPTLGRIYGDVLLACARELSDAVSQEVLRTHADFHHIDPDNEAAWQDALDRRDTADRMFLTVHAKTEVIL
jgi:hypothetical protein